MDVEVKIAAKALASARARLQECQLQINAYADADEHLDDILRDEYLQETSAELTASTHRARAAVRIALELFGLTESLHAFDDEFQTVADTIGRVGYHDEYYGAHNEAVDLLSSRLGLLTPLLDSPSDVRVQRRVLARMLRQLPHYIEACREAPRREKEVQDELYPVLRLAFPDVIREPPIPKQTKTYHPDFGMDSLETAVEVKFVENKTKAALAIGSLYEDMMGYAGSGYSLFVALVYMTGNFLTQEQVDAELRKVGTPKSWKVHLVVGVGGNSSKARKSVKSEPPSGPAEAQGDGSDPDSSVSRPRRRRRVGPTPHQGADDGPGKRS